MSTTPLITRVVLENYKSIAKCDVELGPLTFLVGPNGSGKSNFIDALRFLADALRKSLDNALESRLGFQNVLRRAAPQPEVLRFKVAFHLDTETLGEYAFELTKLDEEGAAVSYEECLVRGPRGEQWFRVRNGVVESNQGIMPAAATDRLYLVNASGIEPFGPCYRLLSSIAVYNPAAHYIGWIQGTNEANLPAHVLRMHRQSPERLERVLEYLAVISRGVSGIKVRVDDGVFLMHFEFEGRPPLPWQSMSDGTLYALSNLVALFQPRETERPLIGIEEPEAGLHPAAAGVLFDALTEAGESRQLVVTTHSAELLDRMEVEPSLIRAVSMDDGETLIRPVHAAGVQVIQERLYTAGELMRMNQLLPERESLLAHQNER